MKEYCKTIIFSKVPLVGYFRYKNEFQIYPVSKSDLSSDKFSHYPIYLEYTIDDEDKIVPDIDFTELDDIVSIEKFTAIATNQTKQDKILQLLSFFSTHIFFKYKVAEGNWVLPIDGESTEEEVKSVKGSKFYYSLFDSRHLNLEIDNFSDQSQSLEIVEQISVQTYYQNDPNYDYTSRRKISFPTNIEIGLEAYYNLSDKEKLTLDAAMKYSVLCMESLIGNVTLGTLSGFTSIETIMNFYYINYKPEICKECGQPKYKIAKRYTDFLLTFIGNAEGFKKQFSNLYSLRSKIVHTGFSFASEPFWNSLDQSSKDEETVTILQIMMLSKLSISNYLILSYLGRVDKHYQENKAAGNSR